MRLTGLIRDEIERGGGAIGFARFMELALYAPGLGYYNAAAKFGALGDFVTAPEVSPLFARCLSRQVGEVLDRIGDGDVLEVGAGTGRMATGLLHALEANGHRPRRYTILEPSRELRDRQRRLFAAVSPALSTPVTWVDDLPDAGFRGVVIANEVLDAMPVCRFRVPGEGGESYEEAGVAWHDAGFDWTYRPPTGPPTRRALAELASELGPGLPDHYLSELGVQARGWIHELAKRIAQGMVIIIDYGYPRREYYHPQRIRGTLRCHYRHRAHDDPLILVGLQDISVHVDFTSVAGAAVSGGLDVSGYTTQAEFLLATGILGEAQRAAPGSREFLELTAQIKHLTLPAEMGEMIKVLALTRDVDGPLVGFDGRDFRDRLGLAGADAAGAADRMRATRPDGLTPTRASMPANSPNSPISGGPTGR